jgi:hypothetical protein
VQDEIYARFVLAEAGRAWATAALPTPVTQTRDFLAASRAPQPVGVTDQRLLTWEPTLATADARGLNERGAGRSGQPLDPTGWAAYQAIVAYHGAVVAAGSLDGVAVRAQLVDPGHVVHSTKGDGVGFRPWDHQLRQPLYVTELDAEAPWGDAVSRRLAVGRLVAIVPDTVDEDMRMGLDRFGDGPADAAC